VNALRAYRGRGVLAPVIFNVEAAWKWVKYFNPPAVLTLNLLTWRIWWAPNNASKWQMGFNSTFKELTSSNKPGTLWTRCWVNPHRLSRCYGENKWLFMWSDFVLKWSEVMWSALPYTEGTWLYCDYFIWCVSCTVVVLICSVMCGCVCVWVLNCVGFSTIVWVFW
jgi:hypothetical protein